MTPRTSYALATEAANTNVVVTLSAISHLRHALAKVIWSYNGTPTGGRLVVTIGGVSVMDVDITASGPGSLNMPELGGDKNAAMVITLYAGGGGVTGKLNVYAGART